MKRTILFPTDFTINSLNLVKTALNKKSERNSYNILLLHGMFLTKSITELLFLSKEKIIDSLTNPEFEEACDVIKNKFDSQIATFKKDIFTGMRQAAFDNYVEGNNIHEAFLPSNYNFKTPNRNSFDIVPFIKKSNLTIHELDWNVTNTVPERGRLAEVFINNYSTR